ncbi:hypothetical protein EB796_021449 [Bugula neritina]|uniref:Uncharacterized protein n=1 Tax=Bugula neritina TaxID=10212 RepID=A0A7J7J362_BUGNE|nr:hypothetical protein EB796_021449 [Bugula neritina]
MCGHSMRIRHMLGLPEKECGDISDDASRGRTAAPKSTPKATIKEEKKVGKEQPAAKKDAKTKEAAKKSDRASPTKKNPPAKAPAPVAAAAAVEERATPSSLTMEHPSSPTEAGVDAKLEMKYKEKLYIQAYLEMHKLIGDIVDVFEEIKMESSS